MRVSEMQQVPFSRATFERNLNLLVEAFKQDRIRLAPGIPVDGFLRVRGLPNGRVDFLSVDETTRLQANMMAQPWARGDEAFAGGGELDQDGALPRDRQHPSGKEPNK